jgi:uncharacterized protein (TIGR02001 family)
MHLRSALACLALLSATPALAVDLPGTGLSLSGSATMLSDYRFRGVSLNKKDPALQLDLSLSHATGFYAGVWGSNADVYDDDPTIGFKDGADIEIDYYGGWTGDVAKGVTIDLTATYYTYPGVTGDTNYAEFSASATTALGPLTAKVGGAWFPDQAATTGSGTYMFGELGADIPSTPVTLTAHLGRQGYSAGFGPDADYLTWSLTAEATFGPVTASIGYIDTDLPAGRNADGAVLLSLGVGF